MLSGLFRYSEVLAELYPESIRIAVDFEGFDHVGRLFPIHEAASRRDDSKETKEIIKYLLMVDPTCASRKTDRLSLPLHVACCFGRDNIASVKLLYDVYPEAINETDERGDTPVDVARDEGNEEVTDFLEQQLPYAVVGRGF